MKYLLNSLPISSLLLLLLSVGCSTFLPEIAVEPLPTQIPAYTEVELFQGLTYLREERQAPRPLKIHIVTIDLTVEGVKPFVTPGETANEIEFSTQTTSEFVTEFGLQVAINGGFFRSLNSNESDDSYPERGNPVDVIGLTISDGVTYSASEKGMGVLCVLANNQAQINDEICPTGTIQALAGGTILIDQGMPITSEDVPEDGLHPRTAVAIDEQGETLWLIVVDGRQEDYSEGIALVELANGVLELGAHMALNLDGGGSTTLVVASDSLPRILNRPINSRIPMRERAVANHLGIFAQPLEP